LIRALGFEKVDLLGFSLGGCGAGYHVESTGPGAKLI
jgi:hypothetical protein